MAIEDILYDLLSGFGDSEYPKLLKYYSDLPDNSAYKNDSFLIPLCNYRIKKEVEYAITNNIKSKVILSFTKDIKPSSAIDSLSGELKNCWYLFKSFESHYKNRLNQDSICDWYSVQSNYNLFYKEIEEILKSDSVGEHMKEIRKFQWGGWCGTGSEFFYDKQKIAILILLLKEKNYPAIIGNLDFTDNIGYENFRMLIQLYGYDWIDYYTGVMIDGKWQRTTPYYTRIGGEKAANNLIKMKEDNFANIYGNSQYLSLCGGFIIKKNPYEDSYNYNFFSNPFFRNEFIENKDPVVEVSPEVKEKLAETIVETVKNDTSIDVCSTAAGIFSSLPFSRDIKEILLGYTKSKFKSIREKAAKILKKNGINIELPPDNGLVTFRLLLDSIPLSKFNVGYDIITDTTKFGYSMSSSLKTSANGLISFSKDLLLSMKSPVQKIRFTSNGFSSDTVKYAFFCADAAMPKNLTDTTDVFISTGKLSLNINLNRDKEFYKNKEMDIYLSNNRCSLCYLNFKTEIKNPFTLPQKIQKGKYSLHINVPGSKRWMDFIEINQGKTNLDIKLEHGTNVIFRVKAPGGKKADKEVMFELINNDNKNGYFFDTYDYTLSGYESLPTGNYTLRITSSQEKKRKIEENNRERCSEIMPDFVDYKGKDIDFSIDLNSPETIDLGTIELEPLD